MITVSADVLEGLEAVRESGLTNMLDRPVVTQIAYNMGFIETAGWILENPKEYARGVFFGFTTKETA